MSSILFLISKLIWPFLSSSSFSFYPTLRSLQRFPEARQSKDRFFLGRHGGGGGLEGHSGGFGRSIYNTPFSWVIKHGIDWWRTALFLVEVTGEWNLHLLKESWADLGQYCKVAAYCVWKTMPTSQERATLKERCGLQKGLSHTCFILSSHFISSSGCPGHNLCA